MQRIRLMLIMESNPWMCAIWAALYMSDTIMTVIMPRITVVIM